MKWKGRKVSNKRHFDLSREKKRNDEGRFYDKELMKSAVYRRLYEKITEDIKNGGN